MMNTNLRISVLILLAILVAACAVPPELPQQPTAVIESTTEAIPRYEPLEECFTEMPEGIDYECGYVTVPEFHSVDNGRTIELGVLRFPSTAETPGDPVFLGAGGPGQSAIPQGVMAAYSLQFGGGVLTELLATRDLVYFSQRGTAFSMPDLSCPIRQTYRERVAAGDVTAEELRQTVSDAMLDCYQAAVDDGVDFVAFNSLENAADVDSIRQALGYDQIIYYGESYGTLLGQHLLRDFPEALSAVILDGVVPIDAVVFEERLDERFAYALEQLIDLCAADVACEEAFPTLADDIEQLYQQLEVAPYEYMTYSGAMLPIDGEAFAISLFNNLYAPILSVSVPMAVDAILNGAENEAAEQAVSVFLNSAVPGDDIAQLMHFAVTCAEDPIDDVEEAKSPDTPALSVYSAFVETDAAEYVEMCVLMDLPILPDETDLPVSSDIPVLFLHGQVDPATPEYFVTHLMDTLPNSYSFTFPYGGHVQAMNDSCSGSIALQFMEDPTKEPDRSCLQEYEPPTFSLPSE